MPQLAEPARSPRDLESGDSTDTRPSEGSASSPSSSPAPPPPPAAPRAVWSDLPGDRVLVIEPPSREDTALALKARTYYRRKEEKQELESELAELQERLADFEWRGCAKRRREEVATGQLFGQAMRSAIHSQRVQFANTMSFVCEFLRAHDHSGYEPTICLGTDPGGRNAALLRLKPQRLEVAARFLQERQRFMTRTAEFCDLQRFEAANGDLCLVRFDIQPIHGARSVKQAFDAVLNFTYNLELSISALVGNITLRENEDASWNSTVAQHRLVTTISDTLQVDTNNVTFADYWPSSGFPGELEGKELGVASCNYVDEDAQFPYSPTRLRQDITFHVVVRSYPRPGGDGSEQVVVLSRWSCFRIRKPAFPVPAADLRRTRSSLEQVGNAMLDEVLGACEQQQ